LQALLSLRQHLGIVTSILQNYHYVVLEVDISRTMQAVHRRRQRILQLPKNGASYLVLFHFSTSVSTKIKTIGHRLCSTPTDEQTRVYSAQTHPSTNRGRSANFNERVIEIALVATVNYVHLMGIIITLA
jgi:hypothetical protein